MATTEHPAGGAPVDVAAALREARTPHDLFGELPEGREISTVRRIYRRLAAVTHPDRGGDAEDFHRLNKLFGRAVSEIEEGTYGTAEAGVFGTKIGVYELQRRLARGDIADLFLAKASGATSALKIVRSPPRNALLGHEAATLKKINKEIPERWQAFFPEFRGAFSLKEEGKLRRINVLNYLDGFFSLRQVKAAYPYGLDPRDMAWMWRRLLVALDLTHTAGAVHGAITPDHVMIHPELHGLVVVGWSAAKWDGAPLDRISKRWEVMYPSEVREKKPSRRETDIYMAASTINTLSNGTWPAPIRAHFRACTLAKAAMRPDSAFDLKETFDDLIERLWGPRRYRPFSMTTNEGS